MGWESVKKSGLTLKHLGWAACRKAAGFPGKPQAFRTSSGAAATAVTANFSTRSGALG
jgi:hypothetical protein